MNYRFHVWLNVLLFWIIFLLDRMTKCWALLRCASKYVINQYLSCELMFNRGVSWSLFDSPSSWVFVLVSSVIAVVIAGFSVSVYQLYCQKKNLIGSVLVLAGAVGNFGDRFLYSGVVDFISIGSFPVFNVADIAICCGIGIMVIVYYDQF